MTILKKIYSLEDAEKLSISEIKNLYNEYVNPKQTKIFSNFPFGKDIFVKAKDMYIYTSNNKKILDFTGGLGVLNHGHNNSRIKNVRINFAKNDKMEVHKIVFSPYLAALSHNLSSILDSELKRTFLCNSGAEAVEGAIKLSFRASKNKKFILSTDKSYHGKLIATGSISGALKNVNHFPKISDYDFFKFNNLNSLEEKLKELSQKGGVYAVIIEPFSATLLEACSENFIKGLVDLRKKYGFAIICDEVYCAWYKCGEIFYFKKFKNFQPDLITLSKSLGGGKSSISALVATKKIYDKVYGSFETATLHTTTYNGFGEECATAIEAINILLEEDYASKVKNLEEKINKHLKILKDKHPKKVKGFKGVGSLFGIDFFSMIDNFEPLLKNVPLNVIKNKANLISKLNVASISSELYSKHEILTHISESENSNFLYISPSLIASNENIEYFFKSLDEVLKSKLDLKLLKYIINSIFNIV